MRFAYAGIDFMAEALEGFLAAGWEPVKLFTRPCDGVLDHNERVIARARSLRIPIQMSRLRPEDLATLSDCCLVVAGYPWRIEGWRGAIPYALNFHPSPLPEGRGPYPLYRALLEGRRDWGVSAHVIEPEFDTGAVIAQERFPLGEAETHETLLMRCQMATGRLARRIAGDFAALWAGAEPQGRGSYWPRATDAQRTLDWTSSVDEILGRVRAFGAIETLARVGPGVVHVAEAQGWREPHGHAPGTVVHTYRRLLVVAARDGYVVLTRWSPISREAAREIGR
ncbi:methionyl-tRNA formyltransferase [Salinarimonas sp.]|uniref:methionyl-tRNA formyltransferase n=1 Tax=Salinarimonas sp. TaxID=2766526 RepID=UPI00391A9CDB